MKILVGFVLGLLVVVLLGAAGIVEQHVVERLGLYAGKDHKRIDKRLDSL